MTSRASADRGRIVRPRRRSDPGAALSEADRRLLDALCAHRVVTQDQLQRLFPDVPERTLRYRTRRLHDLGLAGRTRPYRERGSAPNHHWPTRRADCLLRGEPFPKGGERYQPNPVFLKHAAMLTELYVSLLLDAPAAGLSLVEYRREMEAREPFKYGGEQKALAPDALIALEDEHQRKLLAWVELDLGTMSHGRLRFKAELYAAYADKTSWEDRHPYMPALLFLTTNEVRARRFVSMLAKALSYGPRSLGRRAFVAGAANTAFTPGRLLREACLFDLDGKGPLTLLRVLDAARAPYERMLSAQRLRHEAEEEKARALSKDPVAMRAQLANVENGLRSYIAALGPIGERTLKTLTASTSEPSMGERHALEVIARDLGLTILEPGMHTDLPEPSETTIDAVRYLAASYRSKQAQLLDTLAARCGEGPRLRTARATLQQGQLLDPQSVASLEREAQRDAKAREEQDQGRAAYLVWREGAARQAVRNEGRLARLKRSPHEFYPRLDRQLLRFCSNCREEIYPQIAREPNGALAARPGRCHYCGGTDYATTTSNKREGGR